MCVDPLEAAFEVDLAMWQARLYAVRAERFLMGRLQRVYGAGWLALTGPILAPPRFGAPSVFAALVPLVAMLVLVWKALICSLEQSDRARSGGCARDECS